MSLAQHSGQGGSLRRSADPSRYSRGNNAQLFGPDQVHLFDLKSNHKSSINKGNTVSAWRLIKTTNVTAATQTTACIKREAVLSARSCAGASRGCASSTSGVICATADFRQRQTASPRWSQHVSTGRYRPGNPDPWAQGWVRMSGLTRLHRTFEPNNPTAGIFGQAVSSRTLPKPFCINHLFNQYSVSLQREELSCLGQTTRNANITA